MSYHVWSDAYLKKESTKDDLNPEAYINEQALGNLYDPSIQKVMYY